MFRWIGNKVLDIMYWFGDILLQLIFTVGETIFDEKF